MKQVGSLTTYEAILIELEAKASNAARRGKPTMWSYYLTMGEWLRYRFRDMEDASSDAGYAGRALAISQLAVVHCNDPTTPPTEAARWWALGIYARRILGARGAGIGGPRPSLAWLRERAGVAR